MDRIGMFALVVVLVGCSGSPGGTGSSSPESGVSETSAAQNRPAPVHYTPVLTAPVAPAHARYLADAFTFSPLSDGGVPAPKTAVIGSRVARFYPLSILRTLKKAAAARITTNDIPRDTSTGWYSKDWTMDELKSLPEGDPIPFGTILPLFAGEDGEVSGPLYHLFGFQGNFNRFYKTNFGGKDGFVFGADLYGLQQTPLQNQIASELYLTAGKPQVFHAVTGLGALSNPVVEKLSQDRLAFQSTTLQRDYSLGPTNPDDLVSCYQRLVPWGGHNYQTIFLTTDLAAHAQHLVFDRMLQHVEETQLEPRLKTLVEGLVDAVGQWQKDHASADPWPATSTLKRENGSRVTQTVRKMIVNAARRMFNAISFGVFWRFAPSMRWIIRSRNPPPGSAVNRTTSQSDRTRVPPVTALRSPPDSRITGALSPVMALSSTEAIPSITSPSAGITSPASTRNVSPCCSTVEVTTSNGIPWRAPCASLFAIVCLRAFLSPSAWAFPLPSASASEKFAKSTVNQSQSDTVPIYHAGASPCPPRACTQSPVVRTLPTSTTNITGLRAMLRGLSFFSESTIARL